MQLSILEQYVDSGNINDFLTAFQQRYNFDLGSAADGLGPGKCFPLVRQLFFKYPTALKKCLRDFDDGIATKLHSADLNSFHSIVLPVRDDCMRLALESNSTSFASTTSNPTTHQSSIFSSSGDIFPSSFETSFTSIPFPHANLDSVSDGSTLGPSHGQSRSDRIPDALTSEETLRDAEGNITEPNTPTDSSDEGPMLSDHLNLDFRVRDLPNKGLFVSLLPRGLENAPFFLRFECQRLALSTDDPPKAMEDLACRYRSDWKSQPQFMSEVNPILRYYGAECIEHSSVDAWDFAKSKPDYVSFSGKLVFTTKTSNPDLFALKLSPLHKENTTCRLFRRFGSHSFLRLRLPAARMAPSYIKRDEYRSIFQDQMKKWLLNHRKKMLGCSYDYFYIRPLARGRKRRRSRDPEDPEEDLEAEVFLFATGGHNLNSVTVSQLFDWFLPVEMNRGLLAAKAFKRLDLAFSKIVPTIQFIPDQIIYEDDVIADKTPEDVSFRDRSSDWGHVDSCHNAMIMNDGHAEISYVAALKAWSILGAPEASMPSAFQGRIGPAKGVWSVAEPGENRNGSDVWIALSQSQRKFNPQPGDRDMTLEGQWDPERVCFEIRQWTSPLSSSCLYADFLPILADRGVSHAALESVIVDCMQQKSNALNDCLENGADLLHWAQSVCGDASDRDDDDVQRRDCWFRMSKMQQIKRLISAGFDINKCKDLRDKILALAEDDFKRMLKALKLPLRRSTMVMGISDPKGVLGTGEIHLYPSERFDGGTVSDFLGSSNVLVTRHPTLRPNDMQKVRRVFKAELKHLTDVVVFPSKGRYPLAQMLQGGDYDGDLYWVCWEPALVANFLNAPPPASVRSPEECFITKDTKTLGECFRPEGDGSMFFEHTLAFATQKSMLGACTTLHNRLAYMQKTIRTSTLEAIADVHSHTIDAAKSGYWYSKEAWKAFLQGLNDPNIALADRCQLPYKDIDEHYGKITVNDESHIIDKFIFGKAREIDAQFRHEFIQKFSKATTEDHDISQKYLSWKDSNVQLERKIALDLAGQIRRITTHWPKLRDSHLQQHELNARYQAAREKICRLYDRIVPSHLDDPDVARYYEIVRQRRLPHEPSTWDLLKASAFYHHCHRQFYTLTVCWRDIFHIKAYSQGKPPVACDIQVFKRTKVKRPPRVEQVRNEVHRAITDAEVPSDDEEEENEVQMENGSTDEKDDDVFFDAAEAQSQAMPGLDEDEMDYEPSQAVEPQWFSSSIGPL